MHSKLTLWDGYLPGVKTNKHLKFIHQSNITTVTLNNTNPTRQPLEAAVHLGAESLYSKPVFLNCTAHTDVSHLFQFLNNSALEKGDQQ